MVVPPPDPDATRVVREVKQENVAFIRKLVQGRPEFEPVYQEHVTDNYGEVLPHMLMGDFTRWFIDQCRIAIGLPETAADRTRVRRLAQFLDMEYQSGPHYIRELLFVSFLENLHLAGRDYDLVKSFLGPVLRSELGRLE